MKIMSRLFALFLCIVLFSSIGIAMAEAPSSVDEFEFPQHLADFDFSIFDPYDLAAGEAEARSGDLLIKYTDTIDLIYNFYARTEEVSASYIYCSYNSEALRSCSYENHGRKLVYTSESSWLDENNEQIEAPFAFGTNATPASPEDFLLPQKAEEIDLSIFSPARIASGRAAYSYQNDQYYVEIRYSHEVTISLISEKSARYAYYVNGELD